LSAWWSAGLVVAVVGTGEGGSFVVEDWCTADIPKQAKAPDMDVGTKT